MTDQSRQITRRRMGALLAGALAAPALGRAQGAPFAGAVARARGLDQLHTLTIAKAGQVVVTERFRGPPLSQAVNVKSVSKTVVAAITGAAIDRGVIPGLDANLSDVAPRLIPANADPRVAAITVENLVTLQAGLERTSGRNYGAWVQSGDWVAYALSRPFVAAPGARMLYSTGTTHVLGAALAEASGRTLLTLARDWVGGPLGIAVPPWPRDPQGRYFGGNEMRLTPAAMVRFGEMYRQRGIHEGTRVLSTGWVRDSFRARGRSPWSGMGYGLGWFLSRADGVDYALARGYGGQIIAVVPRRGLTVAITSDPTRPARSEGYFGDLRRLIETDIIAAARAG